MTEKRIRQLYNQLKEAKILILTKNLLFIFIYIYYCISRQLFSCIFFHVLLHTFGKNSRNCDFLYFHILQIIKIVSLKNQLRKLMFLIYLDNFQFVWQIFYRRTHPALQVLGKVPDRLSQAVRDGEQHLKYQNLILKRSSSFRYEFGLALSLICLLIFFFQIIINTMLHRLFIRYNSFKGNPAMK